MQNKKNNIVGNVNKVALITGVTGQDGSYLAEFLLSKDYIVHGIKRRASSFNTERIDHIYQDPHVDNSRFILHYGDLTDSSNLIRILLSKIISSLFCQRDLLILGNQKQEVFHRTLT